MLQDWTQEQILWALRKWMVDEPNRKPNPGHILGIMKTARGKKEAAKLAALPRPPEPERKPVTAEQAAQILESAGFRPKTFGDGQ